MKRLIPLILAAAAVTVLSVPAFADSNIFGAGIVLSLSQGGSSSLNLYEATQLGDSRYYATSPTLGEPTLITNGDVANGTENLGTFDTTTTDSLVLDGGEVLTYKNSGDDITGANLYYSISGGSTTELGLGFDQDNVNGNNGDQRWYKDNADTNLLSGLSNGTYTLDFSFDAPFTYTGGGGGSGDHTSPGSGSYTATFTVVPEPSTVMMLLTSCTCGSFYLMRRRKK